jgi:hypothetical protein
LRENWYVDDWLSGADTPEQVMVMITEVRAVMAHAGMELVKWGSNAHSLLQMIDEATGDQTLPAAGTILGIHWFPDTDTFGLHADINVPLDVMPTKRIVLSCIARFFDPLGLATPFVMEAKILFQRIWRLGLEWDEMLPTEMADQFSVWLSGLQILSSWRVPRRLSPINGWNQIGDIELHVFCDASESSYGAIVYLCFHEGNVKRMHLVMSRARVAPLKTVTLPRLELLAALLGSRLIVSVRQALRLPTETPPPPLLDGFDGSPRMDKGRSYSMETVCLQSGSRDSKSC